MVISTLSTEEIEALDSQAQSMVKLVRMRNRPELRVVTEDIVHPRMEQLRIIKDAIYINTCGEWFDVNNFYGKFWYRLSKVSINDSDRLEYTLLVFGSAYRNKHDIVPYLIFEDTKTGYTTRFLAKSTSEKNQYTLSIGIDDLISLQKRASYSIYLLVEIHKILKVKLALGREFCLEIVEQPQLTTKHKDNSYDCTHRCDINGNVRLELRQALLGVAR